MTNHTKKWALDDKIKTFGITQTNFKEKLKEYPHVRIFTSDTVPKYVWCEQELGNNWIWAAPFQTGYVDMYFIHTEDAVTFKLKFLHT